MDDERRGKPRKLVPYGGTGPATYFAWNEQITADLSSDTDERMQVSLNAEYDLSEQFREWLSITSPQLVAGFSEPTKKTSSEDRTIPVTEFDEFLITFAAEKLGPRLLICWPVVERLLRWNDVGSPAGAAKLKAFMDAMLLGANLRRGEGYGTVGPETKVGRARLVKEFRSLRERIKATSSVKTRAMKFHDVVLIIEKEPDTFPFTRKNTLSLREFYRFDRRTVDSFIAGHITPAVFVTEWFAWTYGRSPKKLDNMLGRFKK